MVFLLPLVSSLSSIVHVPAIVPAVPAMPWKMLNRSIIKKPLPVPGMYIAPLFTMDKPRSMPRHTNPAVALLSSTAAEQGSMTHCF